MMRSVKRQRRRIFRYETPYSGVKDYRAAGEGNNPKTEPEHCCCLIQRKKSWRQDIQGYPLPGCLYSAGQSFSGKNAGV